MNWVNNDDGHQGLEAGDKEIHLLLGVAKESLETSLWTCAPLSKAIVTTIFWNVSHAIVHSLP